MPRIGRLDVYKRQAETCIYRLDQDKIDKESRYDGFDAVITNLDCNVKEIIRMNQQRWELEENFRIMKTEFEARPVYCLLYTSRCV